MCLKFPIAEGLPRPSTLLPGLDIFVFFGDRIRWKQKDKSVFESTGLTLMQEIDAVRPAGTKCPI